MVIIIQLSMGLNDNTQEIIDVSNSNVCQIKGNGNTVNTGISVTDAINICHEVVKADMAVYAQKASDKAQERLAEISAQMIESISKVEQNLLEKLGEPAVQLALRKPVLEYIKTGDKDEAELMIDNLIQRLKVEEHTTEQSVIDEASSIIPKLSVDCLNFLSLLVFSKAQFGFTRKGLLEVYLPKTLSWFKSCSRITELDIAYLRQIGCCSGVLAVSYNEDLEESFLDNYNWIFRDGIPVNEALSIFDSKAIPQINKLGLFCIEGEKLYVALPNKDISKRYLTKMGYEGLYYNLKANIDRFPPYSKDILAEMMKDKVPYWEDVSSLFKKQSVKSLFINPVGYYIASRKMKLDLDLNLHFKEAYG